MNIYDKMIIHPMYIYYIQYIRILFIYILYCKMYSYHGICLMPKDHDKFSHQKYQKRERERESERERERERASERERERELLGLLTFVTSSPCERFLQFHGPVWSAFFQKLEAKPGEKLWTFLRLSLLHFVHPWAFDLRLLAPGKKDKNHQTQWRILIGCEEDSPTSGMFWT